MAEMQSCGRCAARRPSCWVTNFPQKECAARGGPQRFCDEGKEGRIGAGRRCPSAFMRLDSRPLSIPVTMSAKRYTDVWATEIGRRDSCPERGGRNKADPFGSLAIQTSRGSSGFCWNEPSGGLDACSIPHPWLGAGAGRHHCRYRMAKGRGKAGRWVSGQDTHQSGTFDAAG
jgi:hypothetical protein